MSEAITPISPPTPPEPASKDTKPLGNTQGFESRELVRLFAIIDKLRECGVSEDISLPQVHTLLFLLRKDGPAYI